MVEIKNEGRSEADGRKESVRAAVVAHGDAAPVFDATEHDLDFVALLVERFVIIDGLLAVLAWRDAGCDALGG